MQKVMLPKTRINRLLNLRENSNKSSTDCGEKKNGEKTKDDRQSLRAMYSSPFIFLINELHPNNLIQCKIRKRL